MNSTNSNARTPRFRLGLLSICLLLSIQGCALFSKQAPQREVVYLKPDSNWTRATPLPSLPARKMNNEALYDLLLSTRAAVQSCNADKNEISNWGKK